MPAPTVHSLTASDGMRLHLSEYGGPSADRTLVLVHGYGEHGGRYHERVEAWAEDGWRVLVPDLRGHGKSDGRRGAVTRWSDYHRDLEAVFALVETSPERTGVFGHSNGGLVVGSWLVEHHARVGCATLTSPLLGIAVKAPGWKVAAGKLLSRLAPKTSLPSEIDPGFLSHDPAVVRAYQTDPLNHHVVNARWFTEAVDAMQSTLERAPQIACPLLVMQAADDALVDTEQSRVFAKRVPGAVFESIDDAFHELLFEVDGARHAERVADWFDTHIPAAS